MARESSGSGDLISRRLDADHAAKLERVAERADADENAIARQLLSEALDALDTPTALRNLESLISTHSLPRDKKASS